MSEGEDGASNQSVVGYKRPPVATRFKKGRSGNPSGRPKRRQDAEGLRRSVGEVILHEAYRPIDIRENDKIVRMPMIQAVIRSLGIAAAKGSLKAQLAIAAMVETVERRAEDERHMLLEVAIDYKRSWDEVFEDHDRRGVPRPNPVPHPDEIVFDSKAGGVIFNGPSDDLEAANWANARECREEIAEDIVDFRKRAKRTRDPARREELLSRASVFEGLVRKYDAIYPDEETRRRPGFRLAEWRERQWRYVELHQARQEQAAKKAHSINK